MTANDRKRKRRAESIEETVSSEQLIIGLDFGTTFSGIAYAFATSSKPDLFTILDWPGLEGHKAPKIPTVISYDPRDKITFTWGAQRHRFAKIEGIKLLLDPGQETPMYLPTSTGALEAELGRLGKSAVEIATDYISAIYKHAMTRIESRIPADYLQMCEKKFVVSVPAAAKRAGIDPLSMIKEPEAAALYTLHVLQKQALSVGDAFILVDAGGGTVDLISYEINSLLPRLELRELVPGKGGMAGSLGLNRRFEQAINDIVGEDQFEMLRKTKGFEEALRQFDISIKTAFRGDSEEEFFVNFPMSQLKDDPANNIQANCWNMKGDCLRRIFQPLITDIQRLVDEQINLVLIKRMLEGHKDASNIKAIFLVGGFGSSEYLKQRLAESHKDIQVIQPHDSWSAIVKGAVLSKLPHQAIITSVVATRHYGVEMHCDNENDADKARPQIWCNFEKKNKVLKMQWYIHTGQDLKRDKKIVFNFYQTVAAEGFTSSKLIFTEELLQCEQVVAPEYPEKGVIQSNCRLKSDLRKMNREHLCKKTSSSGESYYEIPYALVITLQAAVMSFSVEVNGKEMGSVEAKYH